MKAILDTNFLVYCAKQKIDYASEISRIAPGCRVAAVKQTADELQKLAKTARKLSDRNAAKLALRLLKFNKVQILDVKGKDADKALKMLGKKGNIVATLDKNLKYNLDKVIVIESRKKLAFA